MPATMEVAVILPNPPVKLKVCVTLLKLLEMNIKPNRYVKSNSLQLKKIFLMIVIMISNILPVVIIIIIISSS